MARRKSITCAALWVGEARDAVALGDLKGAGSSAQADVRREDHSDELLVTDSHRDSVGEASGEAGSSPCLPALSCADTNQGGSHLLP